MSVRRVGITVVLLVTAGALLAAFVIGDVSGRDTAAPHEADPSALSTTAGAAGGVATDAFPVRSMPGSASVVAGGPRPASSGLEALGIPSADLPPLADGLGPPAWVRPGTRLTFYSAAASVAQSRFAWVEDPNGSWEDPVTGTRYRRTDETGESIGSASGDGVGQLDVLAVEGTDVVLTSTLYGIDHSTNTFVPGPVVGGRVPGAQIDGTWVHPERLAQLQEARADGLLILRGPYELNGTTYRAISFALTTPGAYAQYTYDTETGVLLSATSRTAGATSAVTAPGEDPPAGNTQLTVTFFAGLRQRTFPGATGVSPGWVGRTPRLDYTGTYHWANPVDPTSGSVTSAMSMAVSLGVGGDDWAGYAARTTVQRLAESTTGTGVTGPTGLYWLSPQALAALAALPRGRVLDSDPLTREKVVLESVGRDPATGRELLTLTSRMPGITTQAGYDTTSGVLAAFGAAIPGSGTTIDLRLQGGP